MLIKLRKSVADADQEDQRRRIAEVLSSNRSLVVIALEVFPGKVVFWLDHSGVLISVPIDFVEVIVDGSLPRCWRVSTRSGRLFIGPAEIASPDFQVDPTERSQDQENAYVEARKSIFEEAAKVDPEALDVRHILG